MYNDEDKNNAALDIDLLSGDIEPVSNLFWFKLIDLTILVSTEQQHARNTKL